MSSLALMRWLEGSPERYDAGMHALTLGRVASLHTAVVEAAAPRPGARVLEIGCGTGTVTTQLHARGAQVTAIDQSPDMLEQAKRRVDSGSESASDSGSEPGVVWLEQTASEIDRLPAQAYDAVVICLCLSDMSRGERAFVIRESTLRLAPGGRLVVADEVHAPKGWRRAAQLLWRIPQAALGWLVVGSLSRPIPDLAAEIGAAGVAVTQEQTWLMGSLRMVVAERQP